MQPSRFPGIDDQLDELVAQNQDARANRVQPTSSRYPAIDAHLGEIQQNERLAVDTTLDLALPRNPDKAAEAQTLADRFKLDMATVQAKQDELARIARGEDIRKALVASPILRRQMTDMKFAEIAHDDVETLSGIESVMTAIKNTPAAIKGGLQSASAGVVGLAQIPFELLDPVGEVFSGTILPENPLRRVSQGLGEYRKWIDDQAKASMPKGSGNIESGYYSGMASLSRNLATLPMLFAPGGQGAALTGMVAPVVGEEYGNARAAGMNPTQSLVFGGSQGAIEFATEKIPVAKLLGDLKVGETFLKTLGKQALYEVPGEQVATVLQDLNTWAAIESNQGKTIKDYLAERPDAAVQTLVATLVGTGGQVSVVKAVDMAMGHIAFKEERAAAAEQHAAALGQLGELVKASKALARSPQSVAQFVQEAAKEQGAENVYVDARVFNQAMQEQGIGLDQIPGPLRDQLAEAVARGGDVVIPVGTFTTEIASKEYGQALADHVKLDPNGMSRAEAVEFMATKGEELQQEVERTLYKQETDTTWQASRDVVKAQIQQELDAVGRFTPEKNEADAALFASYYAVRAAQLGITPEEMYQQRRVKFAAESLGGQELNQITPEQAMETNVPVELPTAPEFAEAVVNTPGAQVTENGLLIDLVRFQKPEQEGGNAIRTGVFYLPKGSPNVKHYRITPSTKNANAYGGAEKFEGATLLRRPLFVKGATGGKAPEAAYDAIKGKGAMKKLDSEVFSVVNERGWMTRQSPGTYLMRVQQFLRDNGGEPGLAYEIIENSKQGNTLRYALQEHIIAHTVRAAGYDAVVGYSKGKAGASISEVFDVREQTFPARGMESQIHDAFFQSQPVRDQTETEAFKRWFGDSKVVDAQGKPLVVYHGTSAEFDTFDAEKSGNRGFYFAKRKDYADSYAKGENANLIEAYVSIKNPIAEAEFNRIGIEEGFSKSEAVGFFKDQGYDGIIGDRAVVAFFPEQIKSATGNRGTFDPNDPNILFQSEQEQKDLVLTHNLTAENLLHADKMGGIAVPSLAVTKKDNPLTGFGEITLIGAPEMADPKGYAGTKVFGADIYSPRYPNVEYKVEGKALKAINEKLKPFLDGGREIYGGELSRVDDLTSNKAFKRFAAAKLGADDQNAVGYHELKAVASALFTESGAEERIFRGYTNSGNRKYIPHTLDNVVAILKKELRGGENFSYGVGSVRAKYTPKFNSIKDIRKSRDRLVSKEEFAAIKKEVDDEFFKIGDELSVFHRASNSFGYSDAVALMMSDAAKMGIPRALKENGFEDVSPESMETVRDYLNKLRTLPTEYFEAKILRAVDLAEFSGAVVPDGVNPKVIEALQARGVKDIRTYKSGDEADRAKKIGEFENLFFQQARGAFSPENLTVTLLRGADLSTTLHEGAHFFFENDIALAAELVRENTAFGSDTQNEGSLQILADVSALMNFHGITGTIEEQLAQWYGMDFKQKRVAHERTAESFEKYMFEGNAPSVELAPYFQRFRAWMLSVYLSIKDFLIKNPEAGKLDDTVRGVFDRMLATREQIEIAQQARSMMPLFASAEAGGYTAQEFQAYQELDRQTSDTAADELEARALRDMAFSRNARSRELKRLQKEAAGLRSEARIEARRQVMTQPVYKAWQFLTRRLSKEDRAVLKQEEQKSGASLNPEVDSLFVAIAKLGGLDRAAVESAWGWDKKERSPQPAFGKPLLRREGGLSIDAMAERLAEAGYLSGVEADSEYLTEFEEKFDAETRGDLQYSVRKQYEGERRAGDDLEAGDLGAGRFDSVAIREIGLPEEVIAKLEGLGMVAKDGLHPDIAIDMIEGVNAEYANGEQLARALAAATPPNEAIEALTDRLMLEQHGELATEEAIERSADLAIHNEVRARMVASELNAINRMAGKPKILATAAKEYAVQAVNRMMLKSVKPHMYAAASARAARASEKAFRTGDLDATSVELRNELINAYAAVAAKDALAEARATVKYFNSLTKGTDKKTVQRGMDPDVLNAARFILGAYGVGVKSAERAADYLDILRRNNPDMAKVLEPSITATLANARPLQELTIEQLRGLREEIEAMVHLAKRSRLMEVGGNLLDREEVVAELDAKLEEIGVPDVIPGEKSAITPMEKAKSSLQYAGAILRRVEQWAEAKDGKFGGPFLRYVFQPVKEAADRYRADRSKYRKAYLDLVKAIAPSMKSGLIQAPELGYTFGKGHNGVAMAELLHAILHTGNESNRRKLLLGRGWAVDMGEGQMDTGRWDAFIDRMHREGILRKEHYDFAQGVWDLLDSMKSAAQKTHRDVFGMYFQEVTADEFNTPFGTYRGGYVPAQADPQIVKDASLRELAEQENQSMAYSFPTTSKGFTKSRVEYNRPLKLDLRSLSQHIDKVLLFTHMEPAVRDVNRVITDKGLSGKLARVDPASIDGMLAPWLKRSATQQVETPIAGDGGMSRVLSAIRSRAGMALMFGNISNTIQQVTGLVGAANKVRPGLLAKATASYLTGPKAMAENVAQSSVYMKDRMANEVAAIHNQMSEILLDPSYLEKTQAWTMKHAYFLQTAMDNVIGPIVWTGAYNQALQQGMDDADAVRFADGVVRQTQGTTLPEDVSRIETGPAYARLFNQFIGYFNMLANTNATELSKVMREVGIKKGAGKIAGIVFFGLLSPAWIAEAIAIAMRGGPDDEDDDGYLDDWLMQVAGLGSVKFALAGVPFVGQFVNAGINRFNGNPVDDRVSLSPAVSLAEGAFGAPYSVYQAMVNDGNASKAVKDVGTAVTLLTGLPAHWAARPVGYMTGIAEDRIEPEGPLDFIRGVLTGTASPDSRQ